MDTITQSFTDSDDDPLTIIGIINIAVISVTAMYINGVGLFSCGTV